MCGSKDENERISKSIGYSDQEIKSVSEEMIERAKANVDKYGYKK